MRSINLVPFFRAVVYLLDLIAGLMIEVHATMSPHDRAHLRLRLKDLKDSEKQIEAELGFDEETDGNT